MKQVVFSNETTCFRAKNKLFQAQNKNINNLLVNNLTSFCSNILYKNRSKVMDHIAKNQQPSLTKLL